MCVTFFTFVTEQIKEWKECSTHAWPRGAAAAQDERPVGASFAEPDGGEVVGAGAGRGGGPGGVAGAGGGACVGGERPGAAGEMGAAPRTDRRVGHRVRAGSNADTRPGSCRSPGSSVRRTARRSRPLRTHTRLITHGSREKAWWVNFVR